MALEFLKDRRVILVVGSAAALAAGLVLAYRFVTHDKAPDEPPPASQGGLVVQTGRDDDLKLDPKRPLRCFVNGQFVGELPLSECARRNGVTTGALDVGLDPSGALAASNGVGANITPLPPQQPPAVVVDQPPQEQPAAGNTVASSDSQGPRAACSRYASGAWTKLAGAMSQSACVQTLFAGKCESSGAQFGRWGDQTLRLTAGRVEISPDSTDFQTLIDPWPGCAA
ncbi:MAG: hypothetical protein ACHP84_06540 [Caulobacterales bacterium]